MRLSTFRSALAYTPDPMTRQPIIGGVFDTDPADSPGIHYDIFDDGDCVWVFRRAKANNVNEHAGVFSGKLFAAKFTSYGVGTVAGLDAEAALARFMETEPKEEAPKTEPAPPMAVAPPQRAKPGPKAKTKPKARPTLPPTFPTEEPAA